MVNSVDLSRFTIPDNDFSWIDMDDFVELGWLLPAESNPETKIMPLAYAPRFTYFRQTDHSDSISGETARMSPFGNEPSHFCIISQDNGTYLHIHYQNASGASFFPNPLLDPRHVQCDLVKQRLQKLEEQIENHACNVGESGSEITKTSEDGVLKDQVSVSFGYYHDIH
jgi:hypothetical protein